MNDSLPTLQSVRADATGPAHHDGSGEAYGREGRQSQDHSPTVGQIRRVDYGDLVVLYDSSKTRIVVIPFFIPHSDHTELAIKLVTHRKAPPPMDWAVVEEKSLSLREPESRKLLSALSAHLLVAESGETGDFLLIRVAEGTAQLGTHDPAKVAAPLTKVLSEDEILQHLQGAELSTELASAFRGAIRLNEMRSAVAQLRSQGWSESKLRALHGLNRRLSGVMVMTYDHLLAQGERLVEMLSPKSEPIADIEAPPAAPLDDDIPF